MSPKFSIFFFLLLCFSSQSHDYWVVLPPVSGTLRMGHMGAAIYISGNGS